MFKSLQQDRQKTRLSISVSVRITEGESVDARAGKFTTEDDVTLPALPQSLRRRVMQDI